MELFTFPPFDVELTKGVSRHDVGDVAGSYDENAHKFGARLFRNGEAVDISGCTVSGYFIRPNGYTVTLPGTVEAGIAWVTLNKSCYYYDGAFTLAVKVSDVGIGTVLVVDGRIIQTRTDSIVDEENTIPSLEQIYSSITRVEQATAAANAAAANAAKTPFIGEGGVWYFWDAEREMYVDSENKAIPELTFHAVTGAPGTNVQLVQTGTPAAPVITLTIPRGDTGAVEGIDYFAGNPSALGTANPGTANGVARGDHVHPLPGLGDLGAVGYNAQSLTDAQKQQARENIAAVSYEAQALTDAQKEQARQNIGADSGYTLPTATADTLGGVKLGGAFTAPGGVLTIDGEPAELVTFIERATYSKNATIPTLIPLDADAFYLVTFRGQGIGVTYASKTSDGVSYIMKSAGFVTESISGTGLVIDIAAFGFAGNGATSSTLSFLNRYSLSGTSLKQSTPVSLDIGPVYMIRKLAQ